MIYPFFKNVGNFVSKVDPKIFDIVFSRVRSYYGPFAAREPHQVMLVARSFQIFPDL